MTLARLETIVLRSDSQREVQLSPVTVLVGPNNAGKSTALRDLQSFASFVVQQAPPHGWDGGTVIESATLSTPGSLAEVMEFLEPRALAPEFDEYVRLRSFEVSAMGAAGMPGHPGPPGFTDIPVADLDPQLVPAQFVAGRLLASYTVSLDGQQRFNLAQGVQSGKLDSPPNSTWMAIEREADLFEAVDEMIVGAFDEHLVIQTFEPPQLVPALSPEGLPLDLRQSTSTDAISAQQEAVRLSEYSDGVQVFCGLVAAVAALPHLLLLIDEPEAFLHPTLCRRLGADLARIARERDARLVAATHSAEFLLGCLDEVPETTVLRLDYRKGVPSSHVMGASEVASLSRDPLLRSSNSLQALFARSAVVCEADSDRAFYDEINRRLQRSEGRVGATDTHFVNAQNWQTTVRIAGPLRAAGVPTAVILDLETVANDSTWPSLVAMTAPDPQTRNALLQARTAARDAVITLGRVAPDGPFKAKIEGVGGFADGPEKAAVTRAIERFADVGIFLVPVGELEKWLGQLGCTNKQTWVTDILGRLGSVGDPAYVEPGVGDTWDFVEKIAEWLEDPSRSGMPTG